MLNKFYEYIPKSKFHLHYYENYISEFPIHYHDALELIYCVKEYVHIYVNQKKYTLYEGEAVIVFPFTEHGNTPCDNDARSSLYYFLINKDAYRNLPFDLLNNIPKNPVIKSYIDSANIREYIEKAYACYLAGDTILVQQYVNIALIMLIRACTLIPRRNDSGAKRSVLISNMLEYISSHFSEDLVLQELADKLDTSKYGLSRLIHNSMDTTFRDILNNYRLQHAESLIRETNLKLLDISILSGYRSLSTFYRLFTKKYGVSPGEYRNKYASCIRVHE